jgi:hypothetical protein
MCASDSWRKIQQDATIYKNFIIPHLYAFQHVSGDTPPIIKSLKLHWQPLGFHTWKVVGRGQRKNPTRCNNVSKFYYSLFILISTCFGRHTAHHQKPKTALAASGFSYVEGCWTWTKKSPTKCNNVLKCYCSLFILISTCYGRHPAHHLKA